MEGTRKWRRTNRIADPAVEEYEEGKSGKAGTPAGEGSMEGEDASEAQRDVLDGQEATQ